MSDFSARRTASLSDEATLELRGANRLVRSPSLGAAPCACVALVEGSRPPELSGEVHVLLRRRLQLAALILFGGFVVFLIRHVLTVQIDNPISVALLVFHVLVAGILGLLGAILCRRCAISARVLRAAEVAIFALPAAFVLAMQSYLALHHAGRGHFLLDGGPWLALIFTYALFIPNTLRRAALVIVLLALAPIVLLISLVWASPSVAALATLEHLVTLPLMVIVAAVGSVFGVHTIGTLRREAFEARRLGQYLLRKRIGAGGMGEVYLAEHQLLKRPCVIKLIRAEKAGDPRVLARFEREVRATAQLTHWNTVEVFDYGNTEDGTFYYVMEFLPGMSLADLVKRFGPLPPERVIYLLRQACDALREAHSMGLVHRDIKPGNIFAAERGGVYDVAKLLDFGLVKPLVKDETSVQLTTDGSITGSPLYMSPEQVSADSEPDAAQRHLFSWGRGLLPAHRACAVRGRQGD